MDQAGGGLSRVQWDIAGGCERPYVRVDFASSRGYAGTPASKRGPMTGVALEIATPCRRCEQCLAHRRQLWSARAQHETRYAPETWFGTLTFRAELQAHWLMMLREDARLDGVDFDQLAVGTQFSRRVGLAAREARKYIATLRAKLPSPHFGKERAPNLRYLLVCEKHHAGSDDSRPHFHMLLHVIHAGYGVPLEYWPGVERYAGDTPTWPAILEREWSACGFSKWRRVTERNCTYLCKYLSKDADNRVRASLDYGAFDYGAMDHLSGVYALSSIASRAERKRSEGERGNKPSNQRAEAERKRS